MKIAHRFAPAVGALALLSLAACEGRIQARLDNSIGLTTYENLGLIEQKPIGVGLVVDEDVRNASVNVKTHNINFTMTVGEALVARLMHALVLQFERVQLLDRPSLPAGGTLDALMVVTLKDLDATVGISPKWNTVATESSGWIEVEAILKDGDSQILWVGTSRSEAEASQQSIGVAGGQDAGMAMNRAIEATVAKLVNQMSASSSLREYIVGRSQGS